MRPLSTISSLFAILTLGVSVHAQPIQLHPENPHYFLFRGEPTILITSAEHYGAVVHPDFDYRTYLEALAADGLNYTRIFTGSYVEPPGAFNIQHNTLAPPGDRVLTPWARSDTPGYAGGGNKFDLDHWNEAYFDRLRDFVSEADRRGIVVEVTFFSSIYGDAQWEINPLHPSNNVNGLSPVNRQQVHTPDNGGRLPYQERLVRQIVRELNQFDNVIYEIQNEPWSDNGVKVVATGPHRPEGESHWQNRVDIPSEASLDWHQAITSYVTGEEASLPRKHLIALNYANFLAPVGRIPKDISIINFHYAWPDAVHLNYGLDRVIGFDESGFAGSSDDVYRRQAWNFLLAGGGLFNNLDYSFTADHPDGTATNEAPGGGSPALRDQLRILKDFLYSFDFVHMQPDPSVVRQAPGAFRQVLANPGEAYAIYLEGELQGDLVLDVPTGTYEVEWIDPVTGNQLSSDRVQHSGDALVLTVPQYQREAAVRVVLREA